MKLRLAQIGAMAYYETRMLWRQRVMPVFVLSTITICSVALAAWKAAAAEPLPDVAAANPALEQLANLAAFAGIFWPLIYSLLLLLGGLAVADVVPRDRQLGVRALIDSTPLTRATYLAGKLCGVWAAFFSGLSVTMVVVGVLGWWLVGPYNLGSYVQMWLGGMAPVVILYSGLGMLLTAPLSSRRMAVMLSLGYGLACLLLMSNSLSSDLTWWGLLNPARPYIYNYYWLGWLGGASIVTTDYAAAQWSIAAGLLQLLIAAMLVWLWLRWREGRE
jgi:hypothetical protein